MQTFSSTRKGSHHWAGNLLLLLIALVVGCIMMEIALRLAGVSFPYFKQVDSVTGFSLRPGAEEFANTEYGQGHWNEQGHRIAGEIIAQELCNHLR